MTVMVYLRMGGKEKAMVKEEYLEQIKNETGLTKRDIEKVINCFIALMKKNLAAKGKINLANFGTFTVARFAPKRLYSPHDGRKLWKRYLQGISTKQGIQGIFKEGNEIGYGDCFSLIPGCQKESLRTFPKPS